VYHGSVCVCVGGSSQLPITGEVPNTVTTASCPRAGQDACSIDIRGPLQSTVRGSWLSCCLREVVRVLVLQPSGLGKRGKPRGAELKRGCAPYVLHPAPGTVVQPFNTVPYHTVPYFLELMMLPVGCQFQVHEPRNTRILNA
jgi:hypothetical protein